MQSADGAAALARHSVAQRDGAGGVSASGQHAVESLGRREQPYQHDDDAGHAANDDQRARAAQPQRA